MSFVKCAGVLVELKKTVPGLQVRFDSFDSIPNAIHLSSRFTFGGQQYGSTLCLQELDTSDELEPLAVQHWAEGAAVAYLNLLYGPPPMDRPNDGEWVKAFEDHRTRVARRLNRV